MPPVVAAAAFAVGIAGLFVLDRDRSNRASAAIWLPVLWTFLAGSRPLSQWLQLTSDPAIDENLEGNLLDRVVFGALVVAGLAVLASRSRRARSALSGNLPILALVAYGALSAFWSDFPAIAVKRWVKSLGDPVMMLVVLTDANLLAAVRRYLAAVSFLFAPLSLLLVKYYPALGMRYSRGDGTRGFIGVATDKNMLGAICFVSGTAAVWRMLQAFGDADRDRRPRILLAHGVVLAMALWLLWSANSMTSIAAFGVATLLMAIMSLPLLGASRTVVVGVSLAALVAAAFPLFAEAGGAVLGVVGRDPTLTQRTELWSEVIRLTTNPLLGAGFESFWLGPRLDELWSHFWWRPNESHNGYLEVFVNLGWVGLALVALVVITGYRRALGMLGREPALGSLKVAGIVAGLIYCLTEAGFRMMHPVWLSLLLATAALPAVAAEPVVAPARSLPVPPPARTAVRAAGRRVRGQGSGQWHPAPAGRSDGLK